MGDLLQSAQVFQVSSRLQSASASLSRIAEGGKPDVTAHDTLTWAARFLTEVDWNAKMPDHAMGGGGLSVQATTARPAFYAAVIKMAPRFKEVGIDTEESVYTFLKQVYAVLATGGAEKSGLQPDRMKLASALLEALSHGLLVQLSGNGAPKQRTRLSLGVLS